MMIMTKKRDNNKNNNNDQNDDDDDDNEQQLQIIMKKKQKKGEDDHDHHNDNNDHDNDNNDDKKMKKTKEEEIIILMEKQRAMGLLYVSAQCIYMQSTADIVVSIGQSSPDLGKYEEALTGDDIYGEWVNGYLAQGRARPLPSSEKISDYRRFREADHIASLVRTNWIFAHMFLAPKNNGNFDECVKLVERAALTMRRMSDTMTKNAFALAQILGFDAALMKPAELLIQEEHNNNKDELQVFVPRLAYDICEFFSELSRGCDNVVPIEEKNEARVAFEVAVCNVFSFGVCTDLDGWYDGVQLCATGLRKRYTEMTPEERVSSGSVLLKDIVVHMDNERYEQAITSALVAARALACNAAKLEAAVEMIRKK